MLVVAASLVAGVELAVGAFLVLLWFGHRKRHLS